MSLIEQKLHNNTEFNRLVKLLNKYEERLPNELKRELQVFKIRPLVIDYDWIMDRGLNAPDLTIMIDNKRKEKVAMVDMTNKIYRLAHSEPSTFTNCKIFHAGRLIIEVKK